MQARVDALRAAPLVDYREVMALKRQVLEELSRCFFRGSDAGRMEAFSAYMAAHPDAEEYAEFRAAVEVAGDDWRSWPDESPTDGSSRRPPAGTPRGKAVPPLLPMADGGAA